MSWTPLHPDAAPSGAASPVTVTVARADGRFRQKMTLTIRSGMIGAAASWCAPGAPISIEQGTGEHAGMLRLRPNGPWRFRKPSGRIKAASISLPPPPGAPAEGCRQIPATFREGAASIEISLPKWSRSEAAPAKPAYVGISQRVPDLAKAIQAANGVRVR